MLTAHHLRRHRALPQPLLMHAAGAAYDLHARWTHTRVDVDGFEALPREPVLLATNASHRYDFFPLRCFLRREGVPVVSIAKGKYFQQPLMAWALAQVGVVPIVSRGYVLAADFVAVHGRRPDDREYRAMRDHIDVRAALPATAVFDALTRRPREIVGVPYDPSQLEWRDAVLRTYAACMSETVRLARLAVASGHHVHLYPEGTVSSRLGTGRRGAIQLARALGLRIVPVGMSGCREAFRSAASARYRGGRIRIRFGTPWRGDAALPDAFRAFDPAHETAVAPILDMATRDLMDRLDALLEPAYRRSTTHIHDGTTGVARFL